MISMITRLIITSHYHLTKVVDILNILDNTVPLHIFDEALLLCLLIPLANWWSSGRLCYSCVFDFKAA